jgi:hypothetical protein
VTIISVFLLSHTLGGFFHDLCLPPLYILITLPLHHRTSTFPTSRPCTISPSSPCQCPWLELEPPQSGLTVLPVQVQQTVQPVQEQQLSYLCKSRRLTSRLPYLCKSSRQSYLCKSRRLSYLYKSRRLSSRLSYLCKISTVPKLCVPQARPGRAVQSCRDRLLSLSQWCLKR